jgi:hypothetical protein
VSTEDKGPEDDGTCALIFKDQMHKSQHPLVQCFAFWVNFVMCSKWQSIQSGRFSQSGDDHLYNDLAKVEIICMKI